jgi:hypothetical protein
LRGSLRDYNGASAARARGSVETHRSFAAARNTTALKRNLSRMRGNDRRGAPRFEILGSLKGTLVATGILPVRDLSRGGALIESPRPLPLNSIRVLRLESPGGAAVVRGRVVRTSPSPDAEYMVAFEFVAPDAATLDAIQQMLHVEADGA